MELHTALKNIVNLSGTSILKELRLVNILADFNAYDDVPSTKFIIKTIIDEGYMEKFLANGKWDLNCNKLIDQFVAMTGVVKDNVSYVFESLGFSVGWNHIDTAKLVRTNNSGASTALHSKKNLQNLVEVINSNEGECKLRLKNPTAVEGNKGKIMVACEVHGSFSGYIFRVYCSVYADNQIIQTSQLFENYRMNFTGFTIASKEIKVKCAIEEISRIIVFIGA